MAIYFEKASFSSSNFNIFKSEIAAKAGIKLSKMAGFGGGIPWEIVADPIKYFLNKKDVGDIITAQECSLAGPRLLEIAKQLSSEYERKVDAISIAEEMIDCALKGKALEY